MNKDKVTVGQFSLLFLLVISGSKFLSLPSLLAEEVGHDSWLVICVAFLWDGICLAFLGWALKLNKHSKLSLDKILRVTLTPVVEKIVMAIFFVLFVTRSIMLLNSCYRMFAVTFDVSTNWIMFVIPIVAASYFAIARGFNSIARMGQLMCVTIVLCIVALLSFTIPQTDFGGILPIAEAGWTNIIKTAFERSFWFADYIFVYFVMENIQVKKRVFSPIFTSFAVGAVLTVGMNIIFVALFGSIAPEIKLAMSKISVFSIAETTNGRWDWLTLSVWIMSVLIKIVIFIYCAYKSGEKLFGLHFTKPNICTILVITLLLMLPLLVSVDDMVQNFMVYLLVPFALVQYLLPLALPLLTKIATKKLPMEVPSEQS